MEVSARAERKVKELTDLATKDKEIALLKKQITAARTFNNQREDQLCEISLKKAILNSEIVDLEEKLIEITGKFPERIEQLDRYLGQLASHIGNCLNSYLAEDYKKLGEQHPTGFGLIRTVFNIQFLDYAEVRPQEDIEESGERFFNTLRAILGLYEDEIILSSSFATANQILDAFIEAYLEKQRNQSGL